MTDSERCDGCDLLLDPEDLFCSRCGRPTPRNDAQATVVSQSAEEDFVRAGGDVTIPEDAPPPPPPSGISFTDRLRHVLGTEFEILNLIGRGGFARVYRARDRRLDRIVAIKVIQPDMAGSEPFMESFRREGIALAKLRHPGIVPIYNIRERGGLIYYIMPFVRGLTLDERLNRGRLPPFESRRILAELTDALAAAHQEKMVHLDIKPENVFLEGDHQKVLLVDFGIAMAVAEKVPDAGGPVVGTPPYMSPEQVQGLPDLDHRSDIYSLGALGYRMLMGRPPFLAASIEEIARKHVEETPTPIRDINPSIPKDFADAIMRCLEKDPWDRFSTAKELGGALEAVTFTTTRETGSHQAKEPGLHTSVAILMAAVAMLVGIIVGQFIG